MCFSTARLVRTSVSAIAALLLPLAISARTSRSRPVSVGQGRALDAQLGGDERLDDLRVQHRPAGRDRLDRRHQLGAIVDALLEQIGAALGAGLQQRQRVGGLGVVAEDDDADPGVGLAQQPGHADALVGARRRHPDVGHHHVGALGVDRGQQRGQVATRGDHAHRGLGGQDLPDALADDQAVIGQGDGDGHTQPIIPRRRPDASDGWSTRRETSVAGGRTGHLA